MHAVEIVEYDVEYVRHSNHIKSIGKLATDQWRTVGYFPLFAWLNDKEGGENECTQSMD